MKRLRLAWCFLFHRLDWYHPSAKAQAPQTPVGAPDASNSLSGKPSKGE